jgi:hypothetical protein
VVPTWGGDVAGTPGMGYAKILRDPATGEMPVVNYWKQTEVVSDNRIPALGSAASVYTFAAPAGRGAVRVTARLIFRRAFRPLAELKGWGSAEIEMASAGTEVALAGRARYLPVVLR